MAILDLQAMQPEGSNGGGGGCGGGSDLSVALCDSMLSVTLCL